MRKQILIPGIFSSAAIIASGVPAISLDTLLQEMVNVEAIARWPQPEFTCKQASSYDRAKVAPDQPGWFANNDHTQYIRSEINEGRAEQVMMEADGPGAIVRFWLTAGGEKRGSLRIYLDGDNTPALIFPAFDLLQGDLSIGPPLAQPHPGYTQQKGGTNLYLPLPYAKHCKVTWEEKSNGARYYQINYRTYAPGTAVTTFAMAHVEASRGVIEKVNRELASPAQLSIGTIASLDEVLAAGAESSLDLPLGAMAVRALELRLETSDSRELERTLRSVILKLTFDDEVTVWCPATDFFGTAVGINELRSWYRQVSNDGTMRCRWVMPYAKSARVSLLNVGRQPVKATLHATTSAWAWDERSMHFHAAWRHESGLKTPPVSDWNFIRVRGRGVYAGDSLAIFNPVTTWYGEGDEKIWVDGESFPSHLGTGTEDYYGYSYAPKGIIQTPFNNHVRIDQKMTQGWNVMSRTRQLDGIPFGKALQFDIELMSWKPTTLTCEATTYWYGFPGATSNLVPRPKEAALPVPTQAAAVAQQLAAHPRRPGAIECEELTVLSKSAKTPFPVQAITLTNGGRLSGDEHCVIKASNAGDFIELEVFAPDPNPRRILLHTTQAPHFGIVKCTINGLPAREMIDGYAPIVRSAEPMSLGVFTPDKGRFVLRVEVTGANPKASGARYFFGLDCIALVPAP